MYLIVKIKEPHVNYRIGNCNPLRYFSRSSTYPWRGHLTRVFGISIGTISTAAQSTCLLLLGTGVPQFTTGGTVFIYWGDRASCAISTKTFLTIPFWERVG